MFTKLKHQLTVAGIISKHNFLVRCLGYGAAAFIIIQSFGSLEQTRVVLSGAQEFQSAQVIPNPRVSVHAAGWGSGDHYTFQTDAQGWSIIEPGQNHRKVYVSPNGSPTADGLTPQTAMTVPEGIALWKRITDERFANRVSHWLLLERGHTYNIGVQPNGAKGESPLHPIVVGAYGSGPRPIVTERFRVVAGRAENLVVRDIHFIKNLGFLGENKNILLENIRKESEPITLQSGGQYLTVRRSLIHDIYRTVPVRDGTNFTNRDFENREQGLYANDITNLLIEDTVADYNSWREGYETNPSLQPPSIYSHNFYLNFDNRNLTFRNVITARAASVGAQMRSGAFAIDNLFLDNNLAANYLGGGQEDEDTEEGAVTGAALGNYSTVLRNVVTSAAVRRYTGKNGGLSGGFAINRGGAVLSGNLFTHMVNPNDPAELARKTDPTLIKKVYGITTFDTFDLFYNDTTFFNWGRGENFIPDTITSPHSGRDLHQVTIHNYARDVLGPNQTTIKSLMEYVRDRDRDNWHTKPDARAINRYFQTGFSLFPIDRTAPASVTFTPFTPGDEVRWDNPLNWSDKNIPGSVAGDSVNIAGHDVRYSGTRQLAALQLGNGATFTIMQGYLSVTGPLTGRNSRVDISRTGQLWVSNYTANDPLTINVSGGRFANQGIFTGRATVAVNDSGQVILATPGAAYTVSAQSRITLEGSQSRVGFDGPAGTATLRLQSGGRLAYVATTAGLGTIGEFRSGYFGTTPPDLMSVMTIEPGATLTLDFRALPATTTTRIFTLANVDELSGTFTTHDVQGIGQNGITGARLVYNYDTDDLVLQVFSSPAAGTGFTFVTQTNNVVSDGGSIITTPTSTTPVIPTPPTTPPKPTNPLTQPQIKALLPRGTASTTLRYRGVTGADLPDGTRCNTAALIDKLNTDRERFHALAVKRQAACLRELRQRAVSEVQADPTHTYPVGLFDFTIETTPGGTEEVTLTLDQRYDTSAWVYRKYKDGAYTTIPGVTYGTRRIDGTTVTTVTYSVTDNGPLDLDPAPGIIRDPAGPAIPSTPPTTPDPVIPPVTEPSVTEPSRSSGGGGGTATRTNRSASLTRLTKNLSYIQPQFNDRTEVEALQRALNYFENANLTVTGTFDVPTFTAVKAFQTKYRRQILDIWNLTEATGYVGITTRLKLNSLIGGQTTTCPAFTEYNGGLSGIRQSPEIGRTQAILQELGMYQGPINNTWDTATNQALITFQETFREVMLDPWNITAGTGYKYKTTNLFLNYFVGCETGTVELEGVGRWGM